METKNESGACPLNHYLDAAVVLLSVGCFINPLLVVAHYILFPFSPAYPFYIFSFLYNPLTNVIIGLSYLGLIFAVVANFTTVLLCGIVYVFLLFHVLTFEVI